MSGSEFGNKNSFTKKSEDIKENSPPHAKRFLGFVKHFSKFAKWVYETTCNHVVFNLALINVVVFSIVQSILF